MSLEVQFKLKNNPNYIKYIREHSIWYKILNRNPSEFDRFVNEMKINYKLRPQDRISKALDTFEMISSIISTLK